MNLRFKKYLAELLGTAMLVFVGCGAGIAVGTDYKKGTGYLLTALAFGLIYIAMYYGLSHISGCHLNPAVSLAMLITKNISVLDFVGYTVSQVLGAVGGCGLITFIFWGHTGNYSANTYYDAAFYSTFVIELIMAVIVVSVFLTTREKYSSFGGIMNGAAIFLVYVFSIQLTGGSANPARTLATAIFAGGNFINEAWIIIGGAFTGALVGALLYVLLKNNERKDEEEPAEAKNELTEENAEGEKNNQEDSSKI